MPVIIKQTYNRHGTGVGIFNMQGFERRNKENKNILRRFSNHKGNLCVNNIKRVCNIFENNGSAY